MKKVFFLTLVFLSTVVLLLRFAFLPLSQVLGSQTKSGIKITSTPKATVFFDGVEVGKTPYQEENLKEGEVEVKLVEDGSLWQGKVKLTGGTITLINRELAQDAASSSGEILTLKIGRGALITSTPAGAEVEIDGQDAGKTPLLVPDLTPEEHTFLLSADGYLKRSIRASLPKEKKMLLQIDVDLAITEVNLDLSPTPSTGARVTVKQTPTGFLRVRDKPSTVGREVGRVVFGDSLELVDEQPGWYKIKLQNGVEGYVSSVYIKK